MNYSVSSDPHFGHANIIRYTSRPFRDLEHMNSEIVRRHNERVKPDDLHLFVGDFSFRNSPKAASRGEGAVPPWSHYWSLLNGHKTLLAGNHDRNNGAKTPAKMLVLDFGGFTFGVTHRPEDIATRFLPLARTVDYWLVGHVHNSWPKYVHGAKGPLLINVSLDVWNFYPVRLDELVGTLRSKSFKAERVIRAIDYLHRGRHFDEKDA